MKFNYETKNKLKIHKIILLFLCSSLFAIFIFLFRVDNAKFDKNFDYINYENEIITERIKNESGWILSLNDASMINGLIRKLKPKNLLEIGVARGGSSILILNAIKDFPDSRLVSIDIKEQFFGNRQKKTGYLVKEKFPELANKWTLFLGDLPYKFLPKLNLKFDFLFLDSAHVIPGEVMNLIEVLPFLQENAIIVLHDIIWHFFRAFKTNYNIFDSKVMPSQIFLISSLIGEKILLPEGDNSFINIGVVCLSKNQKKYYLNYFLLLMNIWQYLPTNEQLDGLREFIKKYYDNKIFLRIFDFTVEKNKIFFKNLKENKYKCYKHK